MQQRLAGLSSLKRSKYSYWSILHEVMLAPHLNKELHWCCAAGQALLLIAAWLTVLEKDTCATEPLTAM